MAEEKVTKCPNCNNQNLSYGVVRYVTDAQKGLESFHEWRCGNCRTKVSIPFDSFREEEESIDAMITLEQENPKVF